jgi:predicted Zn-dependent peptidase
VLDHRPEALTTAVAVMFTSGDASLAESERGLLHVCEHLKLRSARQRCGMTGLTNAVTSKDWVLFTLESHNDVIIEELVSLLRVLLDYETLPTQDEIRSEAIVICDEIRQHRNSAHGQLQLLEETLWERPFCLPAYGLERNISSLTRDGLTRIWREYFSPTACVIAAVGGICSSELDTAMDSARALAVGHAPPAVSAPIPKTRDPGWRDVRTGGMCTVLAGIPARGLFGSSSDDLLALQMLAMHLGNKQNGLYARLRTELSLAYSCETGVRPYGGASLLYVRVPTSEANVDRVCKEIQRVVHTPPALLGGQLRRYLLSQDIDRETYRNCAFQFALRLRYGMDASTSLNSRPDYGRTQSLIEALADDTIRPESLYGLIL